MGSKGTKNRASSPNENMMLALSSWRQSLKSAWSQNRKCILKLPLFQINFFLKRETHQRDTKKGCKFSLGKATAQDDRMFVSSFQVRAARPVTKFDEVLHAVFCQGKLGKINGAGVEGRHGASVVVVIEFFELAACNIVYRPALHLFADDVKHHLT